MSEEIKGILKILKKCEYGACITKHDSNMLLDYITNLQQRVEQLENTIKYAQKIEQEYSTLLTENTELENIRKEAKEFCEKQKKKMYKSRNKIAMFILIKLEHILNKGSE